MEYLIHLVILCCIYVVLAWSLDLLIGQVGVFALCQAAFFAVGAYGYAVASERLGVSGPAAIVSAVVLAALLGLATGWTARRMGYEQSMLFTIAVQQLVSTLLYNLEPITGGAYGISGVPRLRLLGFEAGSLYAFALLAVVSAIAGLLFFRALHRSGTGIAIRAVGDDTQLSVSLGIPAERVKSIAFALAAGASGFCGALYASYVTFIDPLSFALGESILVVTAVLVGGSGTLAGPTVGMVFVLLLPELLRQLPLPTAAVGSLQRMMFSLALIGVMVLRPRGLAGVRRGSQ